MKTLRHLAVLTALVASLMVADRASAVPIELITNGSFETGDFTGWTTIETGLPFQPWQVTGAGFGDGFGMAATSPQDGSFVAWNGFDGDGPMEFEMFQDVVVPTGSTATLSLDFRVQWVMTFGATM